MSLFLRNNHLLRCWSWLWIGAITLSLLLKLPQKKKNSSLDSFYKFFSCEVVMYLYKSTIHPCMEYCFHVWAGAPCCCLEMLYKLQKWICRNVGPSLITSLEPLAHRQNVASWSLFYRYYIGILLGISLFAKESIK